MSGILYIVATPIGNLDDFSPRAVEVLSSVQSILTEDTRKFRVLSSRFGIPTPTQSLHEHNEQQRLPAVLAALDEGSSLALVSEAGTPTISDPGYRLVKACHEKGIPVRSVPGPCALIAALSISGFETDRFVFQGFLPQKSGRRERELKDALENPATVIFYESPHRLLKSLAVLARLQPEREICVVRELTKVYEEVVRGRSAEVHTRFQERRQIRGEYVILIRRLERKARAKKHEAYGDEEE